MAKTVSVNLTKLFALDKVGSQVLFDISGISALMQNENEKETLITSKLANLQTLKEMDPDLNIIEITNEIYNSYGNEK